MANLSLNPNPNPIVDRASRASIAVSTDSRLEIDGSRARQTERPAAPFRSVLAGGVSLLITGAEVATHVVAGPVLAAAVHDARVGAAGAITGAAGAGPIGGTAPAATGGAAGNTEMTNVESLMQQGQMSNLQLLALQQQIQQENQRLTTVSNVMRAKHDTAKAAVSNIRA
jgi:hypothetical protein